MELFDVVDRHGNPTGEIIERGRAHTEGVMHRTAHVWLVRRKEGRVQLLLQKRCNTKESFPGCYDISSAGHIPAGCGYKQSALRELEEELGIRIQENELIFCGDRTVICDDSFHGKPFHDRQYSRVFCVWKDMDEAAFTLQKEEVDSVLWMDLDSCMEKVKDNQIPHCISPGELDMVSAAILRREGEGHI